MAIYLSILGGGQNNYQFGVAALAGESRRQVLVW